VDSGIDTADNFDILFVRKHNKREVDMAAEKAKKELAPYRPRKISSMLEDMDRMFEGFLGRPFGPRWLPSIRWPEEMEISYPAVDIFEDNKHVTVKAELPGMTKEELDVNITEEAITISGEKKKEEKVEEKEYYRVERSHGSFSRTFSFPTEVQSAKARASFKDGVLEVSIPKTEAAKKKKIKVEIE
jgi:HSP20 family protein